MFRNFLPFILASLGFTLVAIATSMPLFDWQISHINADFPPEVQIRPSPWRTRLGESLEDVYIRNYQIFVLKDGQSYMLEDLDSIVQRSRNDEAIERIAENFARNILPWVASGGVINLLFLLCLVFLWSSTLLYKRPIYEVIALTLIAVVFSCNMLGVWKHFLYRVLPAFGHKGISGTVTFDASLIKVHYETLLVLFIGMCGEFGSIGMMLYQIVRAVSRKEQSSPLSVG